MFERMATDQTGIVAFDAIGKITDEDYKTLLIPALEEAAKTHGKVRALVRFGEAFEGYTPQAMLDDTVFGLSHLPDFKRIAVATDIGWIRNGVAMFAHLTPIKVHLFPADETAAAIHWLAEDR